MAYRQPTSTIMICHGYPCDRDHENTLYFASKAAQWTYMRSLIKYTFTAQSYQRYAKNTLRIAARADDLYGCNYLIFSNVALSASSTPADNVPVFYCFIDSVEYINENTTEVRYTIDDLQTFWFNFSMGECYVEREHTETDLTYGNLVPENINIKSYYAKEISSLNLLRFDEDGNASSSDLWSALFIYVPNGRIISSVESYENAADSKTDPANYKSTPVIGTAETEAASIPDKQFTGELRNKTYVAARYVYLHLPPFSSNAATLQKIREIIATAQKVFESSNMNNPTILSVLLVPRVFAKNTDYSGGGGPQTAPPDANTATVSKLVELARQTTLKGPNNATYTPRNKKLLSYPFNSLKVDNNNGESKEYAWEYIDGISAAFNVRGVVVGAPEICAFPSAYNGESNKYAEYGVFIKDFINTLWSTDAYQMYLNNNANSLMYGFITSAIGGLIQAGTGNVVGAVGTAAGIGGQFAALEDRKSMPDKITGSLSFSALRNVLSTYKFTFEQMNVYLPAAARIDHYFDLYGYAIDDLKIPNVKDPNVTLRPCWNYIKTNGAVILPASNVGSANSMTVDELQRIKEIFDKGVRFWMNPAKVGQYSSQDNAPV